jgi:xanthine dehydrogenase accessory factor
LIEIYEEILKLKEAGGDGVLATVVDKQGHCPAAIQAKMLVFADGRTLGTVGGGALEMKARQKAGEVLKRGQGFLEKYFLGEDEQPIDAQPTGMICGGWVTIFYEYIGAGEPLYMFGAGHIGRALAYHLKGLNFRLTVIDDRGELLKEMAAEGHVLTFLYDQFFKEEQIPAGGFVVIATYSHDMDYEVLKRIYELQGLPRYIGLIASRRKRDQMLTRLKDDLGGEVDLDRLYCPCGLDTGGRSPDEIAISMIAEIQALRYGKKGHKHLKELGEK